MPSGKIRKLDIGCVGHAIANEFLFPISDDERIFGYVKLKRIVVAGDEIDAAEQEIERQKQWGEIASRPKQSAFSAAIRKNYDGKCAITGCSEPAALQAAHVRTVTGVDLNSDDNGILLRSDIHALLDAFLVTFSPDGRTLEVSILLRDPHYEFLKTCEIGRPNRGRALSTENIEHHRERFRRKTSEPS
jgi:hypothetical protein